MTLLPSQIVRMSPCPPIAPCPPIKGQSQVGYTGFPEKGDRKRGTMGCCSLWPFSELVKKERNVYGILLSSLSKRTSLQLLNEWNNLNIIAAYCSISQTWLSELSLTSVSGNELYKLSSNFLTRWPRAIKPRGASVTSNTGWPSLPECQITHMKYSI